MKNKLALILAGSTLAIISEIFVVFPKAANAQNNLPTSTWNCYRNAEYVGKVDIWWGHRTEDARWACNQWVEICKNDGNCNAKPRYNY